MRLFFGIGIPDDVRARAVALQEELRATGLAASWVPPQNLHYTMKFLGDVADACNRRSWPRRARPRAQ
ncbi:MAG: 2'-5' RNA ligase family protein [Acidobacteriota bacterium]